MTVRTATADDAAAIIAVRTASWRAAYRPHLPEHAWDEFDAARATERLADSIARARMTALVTEHDHEVVGYAFLGPARDDDLPAGTSELYAIYVRPERWSTGVGRALMSAAVNQLPPGPVVLWVLEVNDRARRFYEQAGFAPDGVAKPADMPGGVQLPELRYRCG